MADGAAHTKSGASTSVTVLKSLISTCNDGPAVSLNGSPTVSPTTAALWVGLPFPPYSPVSMNFLALSQAPPPLLSSVAMSIPAIVPTIRNDATVSAPTWNSTLKTRPTAIGMPTASSPGATMALSAPTVTMTTALVTALMASAENQNTSMAPNSPPTNTSGFEMSTAASGEPSAATSSKYAEKSRKAASAAEPIA